MGERVIIIGADAGMFVQQLIQDLNTQGCQIVAADFTAAPRWFDSYATEHCQWRQLISQDEKSFSQLLMGISVVFYLPHLSFNTSEISCSVTTDTLLLNTHFLAVACAEAKVSKIIYLSAMMPSEDLETTFYHRNFEIEQLLKNSGIPIICLRSAPIIAHDTVPVKYLFQLIDRAPIMLLPLWMEKQVQPVFWKDVTEVMFQIFLDKSYTKITRNINLPGPELLSYKKLLELTVRRKKIQRIILLTNLIPAFVDVALLSLILLRPWRQMRLLLTGLNRDSVALMSDWKQKRSWVSIADAVKLALQAYDAKKDISPVKYSFDTIMVGVRNFGTLTAKELSLEFFYWLQYFFQNLVRIEQREQWIRIYFPQKLILLLELEIVQEHARSLTLKLSKGLFVSRVIATTIQVEVTKIRNHSMAFIFEGRSNRAKSRLRRMLYQILSQWLFSKFEKYMLHD